jgi:glycosyltransferase involved in cell wall biosynthesis
VTGSTQNVFNRGWYGHRILDPTECYDSPSPGFGTEALLDTKRYDNETKIIDERYGNRPRNRTHFEPSVFLPSQAVDRHFASISVRQDLADSPPEPSFSFVTPFFGGSLEYLCQCACSLADLHKLKQGSRRWEWIIVNGSPVLSNDAILHVIPASLWPYVVLLRDNEDSGLTGRLNRAILASRGEWILFIDADDLIMPNAIAVLRHYIRQFPKCRYISSGMVDIDEHNQILRHRLHLVPPTRLFSAGMIAGHLKAVRRDLIDDVGLLGCAFDLAQDYEFAMRVSIVEPLLLIPDYLYCYRWHMSTQSVSKRERQNVARDRARESTILRLTARGVFPSWRLAIGSGALKLAHFLQKNAPIALICGSVICRKVLHLFKRSELST